MNTLPKFGELYEKYGWANAYRKWEEAHQANQSIVVPATAWDRTEWYELHEDASQRSIRGLGRTPSRATYRVTPTGGRVEYSEFPISIAEAAAPLDPPEDELLLLSWLIKYHEQCVAKGTKNFDDLKTRLTHSVEGYQVEASEESLAQLKRIKALVQKHRKKVEQFTEKRLPLLPRSMQPKTKEELELDQQIEESEAALRQAIEQVEI